VRRLAITGTVLAVLGVFLTLGFWPVATLDGAELHASRTDSGAGQAYQGYGTGSQIWIRAKIISVGYSTVYYGTERTLFELEDGNSTSGTYVFVHGDARFVTLGDFYFFPAVLEQFSDGLLRWDVPSPRDVSHTRTLDAWFYSLAGVGVFLLSIAVYRTLRGRSK
jgi:hypothetical protein